MNAAIVFMVWASFAQTRDTDGAKQLQQGGETMYAHVQRAGEHNALAISQNRYVYVSSDRAQES